MNEKNNLTAKETFDLAVQNQQKNNLQIAKNLYKETLKINPNYVDAHNNLGIIFQALGELQKAKSCYEKSIQIDPSNSDPYWNLHSHALDFDEALNILIKLNAEVIECFLEDLGEPWTTKNKPKHNFFDD